LFDASPDTKTFPEAPTKDPFDTPPTRRLIPASAPIAVLDVHETFIPDDAALTARVGTLSVAIETVDATAVLVVPESYVYVQEITYVVPGFAFFNVVTAGELEELVIQSLVIAVSVLTDGVAITLYWTVSADDTVTDTAILVHVADDVIVNVGATRMLF
jgi:hypothetical protein